MLNHRPKALLTGRLALATVGFALFLFSQNTYAQDIRKQTEMYGQGVHEYFDGNYKSAEKTLSSVAKAGSIDPRVFLYRGLARAKMGMAKKAKADFAHGAMLEIVQHGKRNYNIGRSLMRVQGVVRIQIEDARYSASKKRKLTRKALAKKIFLDVKSGKGLPGQKKKQAAPSENLPDISTIKDDTAPFPEIGK